MAEALTAFVAAHGAWGLVVAAFVGATLVPISSEVAVVAALAFGMPPVEAFVAASFGNALGAGVTYGTGRLFAERTHARLVRGRTGRRALEWAERHGAWALLGSWLPVVGDPLCLAAGLVGVRAGPFLLVGIGTRVVRYAVLIAALAR